MAASFEVPVLSVNQLKNGTGFEPRRSNNVSPTQAIHSKTPHRYQQSPVFARKANGSSGGEKDDHVRYRHHSAHYRKPQHDHEKSAAHRRRRGNSEGDKANVTPEEKVHLLSELPWRNSGDFTEATPEATKELSVPSIPRVNVPVVSPSLPRRYADSPVFQRGRTYTMPSEKRSIFARRGKHRAKSQDFSPPTKEKYLTLPLDVLKEKMDFSGSLVVGIVPITIAEDPQTPDTPLADSSGFLKVPGTVPESVQRLFSINSNHDAKGLSEEEIRQSIRSSPRRGSSSSESSTSTLT